MNEADYQSGEADWKSRPETWDESAAAATRHRAVGLTCLARQRRVCCGLLRDLVQRSAPASFTPGPSPDAATPAAPFAAVVEGHRLTNGLLFGLPVVLDTDSEDIAVGDRVLLTYNGEVGGWVGGGRRWRVSRGCWLRGGDVVLLAVSWPCCRCGSARWVLGRGERGAALPPKQLPQAPACPSCRRSRPRVPPSGPPCLQKLAVFTVESKWKPNKPLEAKNCYGTTSIEHPAVQVGSRRWRGCNESAPACGVREGGCWSPPWPHSSKHWGGCAAQRGEGCPQQWLAGPLVILSCRPAAELLAPGVHCMPPSALAWFLVLRCSALHTALAALVPACVPACCCTFHAPAFSGSPPPPLLLPLANDDSLLLIW